MTVLLAELLDDWNRNVGWSFGAGSGAHEWNRTIDLLLTKEVLYRLSYVSDVDVCVPQECQWKIRGGAGDGNRTRTISLEG